MKTIFVLYMPGHAGHFVARLFGLSPEIIPLVRKHYLTSLTIPTLNKLDLYKFNNVKTRFKTWQEFHRSFADHKDHSAIRALNAVNGHHYSCEIYPIHPYEFHHDFQEIDETECYYVDLDMNRWGDWVEQQREELKFVDRPSEYEYFEKYKNLHSMKPISLTKLLGTDQEFQDEYLRVANAMCITPVLDQAILLLRNWKSVRVPS
jgi:hypothetical protein